ncbi:hypothetical protein [Nostoc sp. DedQUE07]|uniref:hypothetical protein n=1 Tax=Nostoc sp. DedQUE07 TaxID=3075392 RepID=UPI002AD5871A|nr:hypothetical protein [Nostoc sp. DedQUE07]MDZ8130062.1 hypothetical protein [Nostoc sp. DedQUE07]
MRTQIVEQIELFSEAELESLEFVPEELEAIEAERVPDLDSISFEEVAKEMEAYFEVEGSVISRGRTTGRIGAEVATRNYRSGTVGGVVHRAVAPLARIFGDFASGNIGQHYRESDHWLSRPATDQNLHEFAQHETRWWQEQRGFAGWAGKKLSADGRAQILICVKNNPQNPGRCG